MLPVHHCFPEPSTVPLPCMVRLELPTGAERNGNASVAEAFGHKIDFPALSTLPLDSWSVVCDGSVSG